MPQNIEISSSKSLLNRALILQSYFPELKIEALSQSDDVINLQHSLRQMQAERELFVGEGGTTLRFLALRVSRIPGEWILRGHEALFQRPQSGLADLLKQLGVKSEWGKDFVKIISENWKIPNEIYIDVKESSQFATSLLFNSCQLDQDLTFSFEKNQNSESYFEMSLKFFQEMGFFVIEHESEAKNEKAYRKFTIASGQRPSRTSIIIESDLSSVFTMASYAALNKDLEFSHFPFASTQPDIEFLNIFNKMNISFEKNGDSLLIKKAKSIKPIIVELKNCPDLFPVLAVLCAQADGKSQLAGASQLIHKESNRLLKTKELLDLCGVGNQLLPDGLEIYGRKIISQKKNFVFDPSSDHRMAMAAALMKSTGYEIKILNPQVVAKSFPEFWKLSGLQP